MKNKYKYTSTYEKLRDYFDEFSKIEGEYWGKVQNLEKLMEKKTKIKGIEFFFSDNECVGIGNADRTMKLVHRRFS